MTNATKTLAVIFVGTLALAAAASWGGGGGASAAFQDQLLAVDSSAVQGLRIKRAQGTVQLHRADSTWTVRSADGTASYAAQRQTAERLLNTLQNLKVNAVATRQAEKHPRYEVDSTGTTVTLLDAKDDPLGSLIVGRTEFQGGDQSQQQKPGPMQQMRQNRGTQVTYVRTPEQADVYSVEESLSSLVNRPVEDWRDKSIWGISQSNIQRVHLTMAGDSASADTSYTLQRAASEGTTGGTGAWISNGDTLSTDATSSLLRIVSTPRANSFANDKAPEDLNDPTATVRLRLKDGSQRTLNLYPDPSGADTYLATASDYPYVARVLKRRWEDSVLKARSTLLSQ